MQTIEEIKGLYRIVDLKVFRRTQGVTFDFVPIDLLPRIDAVDRVIHESNAVSPGAIGNIERPWYMHPYQEDNLIVLYGSRFVEIYTPEHGKIESFTVFPNEIRKNGKVIFTGGVMLSWPCNVFHRVRSAENGSASINLATHYEGFNIRNNFNIYDLDTVTGEFKIVKEGYKDQS